ncbi:hypothetical protein [Flavobacterium sp. ACAM 123]|uniref:hypothetical protein n=1 Tax=Flavobacterium sp. ACAM 123 TaxID=1189620 RepID=UPI0018DE1A67|nr:hypothetical protein [Flavobacterium sp. ACAM 123]
MASKKYDKLGQHISKKADNTLALPSSQFSTVFFKKYEALCECQAANPSIRQYRAVAMPLARAHKRGQTKTDEIAFFLFYNLPACYLRISFFSVTITNSQVTKFNNHTPVVTIDFLNHFRS